MIELKSIEHDYKDLVSFSLTSNAMSTGMAGILCSIPTGGKFFNE